MEGKIETDAERHVYIKRQTVRERKGQMQTERKTDKLDSHGLGFEI